MFYWIAKTAIKIYYTIFFRVQVKGKENIPKNGGIVLCSNHTSNHDPAILASHMPRTICFMAKKELFDVKGLSFLIRHLYAFPVDRSGTDMKAFKNTIQLLKSEKVIGIFAQGTRVKEGEQKAAKAGVALFSLKANVPVVPVAISGNFRLFSKIKVHYGKPLYLEQYKGKKINNETLEEIAQGIMQKINELKD